MVVALGALDLHAHEDARDLAGHLHGLGLVGQRKATAPFSSLRPVAVIMPATISSHGRVGLELLGQPVLERVESDAVRGFRWSRGT